MCIPCLYLVSHFSVYYSCQIDQFRYLKPSDRSIAGCNMLRSFSWSFGHHVATCWVLLAQIFKWSNSSCNVCGCGMIQSFGQVRVTMLRRGMRISSILTRNMSQHVATGWPNACNMLRPTVLRSFGRSSQMLGQQCWDITVFRQTAPLRESRVVFREGPQKNRERANLALYFYKAACRLNPGIVF